jgi:hypothetical protein
VFDLGQLKSGGQSFRISCRVSFWVASSSTTRRIVQLASKSSSGPSLTTGTFSEPSAAQYHRCRRQASSLDRFGRVSDVNWLSSADSSGFPVTGLLHRARGDADTITKTDDRAE